MKNDDLKNAPKLLCENVRIGYTPEFFAVGLSAGTQGQVYSFTPQHAKRFLQYLEHQIKDFEEKNGVINATWDPNIVSPVQPVQTPRDGS